MTVDIFAAEEFQGLRLWWAQELDPEDICQRCGVPWMVHGSSLYPRCRNSTRLPLGTGSGMEEKEDTNDVGD